MGTSNDPYLLLSHGRYKDALGTLQQVSSRRALFTDEQILQTELLSLTGAVDTAIPLADKRFSSLFVFFQSIW